MKGVYKADTGKPAVRKKMKDVEATLKEMKEHKTVALIELNRLPDSLLQKLRKKIREEGGKVRILKKPVITRVMESSPKLRDKASLCDKPVALVLTDWSPYALNMFLKQNRKRRAAKVGEVAPRDIVVPEGETDLPPGPALSELKAGGVAVQIKGGKIAVTKDSVVAKQGEVITAPKVKVLQTLSIMPFEVMANLMFGFDGQYSYTREVLDSGETAAQDLMAAYLDAINVSLNAGYPSPGNASIILGRALAQSMNLSLNAGIYSSSTIEQLLTSAARQGMALSGLNGTAKAGGSDAPTA